MEGIGLVMFLVIGLVAGWLAGNIMRGGGLGIAGNLVVGVVGAFLGGFLFGLLGLLIAWQLFPYIFWPIYEPVLMLLYR